MLGPATLIPLGRLASWSKLLGMDSSHVAYSQCEYTRIRFEFACRLRSLGHRKKCEWRRASRPLEPTRDEEPALAPEESFRGSVVREIGAAHGAHGTCPDIGSSHQRRVERHQASYRREAFLQSCHRRCPLQHCYDGLRRGYVPPEFTADAQTFCTESCAPDKKDQGDF